MILFPLFQSFPSNNNNFYNNVKNVHPVSGTGIRIHVLLIMSVGIKSSPIYSSIIQSWAWSSQHLNHEITSLAADQTYKNV